MPMGFTSRRAVAIRPFAALLALGLLAGCTSSGGDAPLRIAAAPAPAVSGFEAGTAPDFCPQVTLREGTAILTRPSFVASISDTTRDCRVANGQLFMQVGVTGRVMPQAGAAGGNVQLPIRVAVTRGDSVLYSTLGTQSVAVDPARGAGTFSYLDAAVAVPGPADRSLTVFVGFDEGPPPANVASR